MRAGDRAIFHPQLSDMLDMDGERVEVLKPTKVDHIWTVQFSSGLERLAYTDELTLCRQVHYTADIITGEDLASEEDLEDVSESGWWEPDWTLWEVWPDRTDVTPDIYDPDPDEPESPAEWLASVVTDRLGAIDGGNPGESTWYAADEISHPRTGDRVSPAAHATGFTDEELTQALELMKGRFR